MAGDTTRGKGSCRLDYTELFAGLVLILFSIVGALVIVYFLMAYEAVQTKGLGF